VANRITTGTGAMVWLLVPIALIWWQGEALPPVVCLLTCIAILWGRNLKPWPALIWLGTISYSLYLVHFDVGRRVVAIGSSFTNGVMAYDALLLFVGILASAIAAWAVWRFIELPSQTASKTFAFGAREPRRVPGATTVGSVGHEK
jgi:peptidoglycan/LPS O-acetylase OafA/YrhL